MAKDWRYGPNTGLTLASSDNNSSPLCSGLTRVEASDWRQSAADSDPSVEPRQDEPARSHPRTAVCPKCCHAAGLPMFVGISCAGI